MLAPSSRPWTVTVTVEEDGRAILVLDRVVDDDDRALAVGEMVEIGARIEADLVLDDRDRALAGRARGRDDGEDRVMVDVDVIGEDVDHDGRVLARRPACPDWRPGRHWCR